MKSNFLALLIFIPFFIFSQERTLDSQVQLLKNKIKISQEGEKLKWMDSLTLLIRDREEYQYDSIARATINYATELDSLNIVYRNLADLIYNKCNVLGKPEKGLILFNNVNLKDLKKKNYSDASNIFLYGGDCFSSLGKPIEALKAYEKANYFSEECKQPRRAAIATLRMGFAYTDLGEFSEASKNIQKAIKIFYQVKDTVHVVNSKNALSILYSQNAFYSEAKKERNEAIDLIKKFGGGPLASIYFNASADARINGDISNWIYYSKLALKENEKSEYVDRFRTMFLSNLAIAFAKSDSLTKAKEILYEIESSPKDLTEGTNRNYYIEALKEIAFANHNFKKALRYGNEHLSSRKKQEGFVEIYNAEKFLADVYQEMGDTNKSEKHLNNYYAIKDSISSIQNVRTLTYYQTIYETEKRDLKIEAQQANISLLDSKNKLKNQWLLFGSLGLLSIFGFIVLTRAKNTARKQQLQQENFTTQLVNTQEIERSRVANELHDSVGQKLLILKNTLLLQKKIKREEEVLLDDTINEVREMSHNLHPFQFKKVGLLKSLEDMMAAFQKSSKVFYSSEIENISEMIPKEKEIFIYRMLQECISNVEKHANATACNLLVKHEKGSILFQLKDNGKGFDVAHQKEKNESLGMRTLKERAKYITADFIIDSEIKKGTTISIKIKKI